MSLYKGEDHIMDVREARERYDRYLRLNELISEKGRQIEVQHSKINQLYRQLEKENRDVEELERMSFATIFARITGQMEEKREKEVQEAHIIELRFKEAKRVEEELNNELKKLRDEQATLKNAREDYKTALAMKRDALEPTKQEELKNLQDELYRCQNMIKEANEAVDAGNDARDIAWQILNALNAAQNWGFADMMGIDFIADVAKHQKISQARQQIEHLQSALRRFKTELVDIHIDQAFQINISSFDAMVDMFFDNFLFDMMVQTKIGQSKREIEKICDQVESLLARLENILSDNEDRIVQIKEKIRLFIEEA